MAEMIGCDRCGYETTRLGDLKKHFMRKTECPPTLSDVSVAELFDIHFVKKEKRYECEYCNKMYTTSHSKYRHKKICKEREKIDNEKKEKIEQLEKMVLEQQKAIDELRKASTSKSVGTINGNNNNNNNTINIQVNGFGNENLAYITESPNYKNFMLGCIKKQIDGVCNMLIQKHFHQKHPENHNIKKLNKKDKFIDCYDGKKWIPKLMDGVIEEIFIRMERDFAKFLESIQDERGLISKSSMDAFMARVGAPLNWDLSYGNYSFDEDMEESKKDNLKNDLYMLACEYIYRQSKEVYSI